MGGEVEPYQRPVRRVDRRAAALGLPGGNLQRVSRYQDLTARRD